MPMGLGGTAVSQDIRERRAAVAAHLHGVKTGAGSSFNWSADGLASLGVNSIHVDDAGSEDEGFSGADSDAGSECRSDASGSDSGFSDEQESHSPVSAAMRRKPLHIANSSAVRQPAAMCECRYMSVSLCGGSEPGVQLEHLM